MPGYTTNSQGACQACMPNCQYCKTVNTCETCASGFYTDANSVCQACLSPCRECMGSAMNCTDCP